MKTQQQIVEEYIQALKDGEIAPDYLSDNGSLSRNDVKHILTEYELHLLNLQIDSDEIDKPQYKIFTWGDGADRVLSPIGDGFYLLVGSAGSGKTAYTVDLAMKNARKGNKILYLSLEMKTSDIYTRIARSYAGIGKYEWQDKTRISEAQRLAYIKKKKELKNIQNLSIVGLEQGVIPTMKNVLDIIEEHSPDYCIVDNFNLISREKKLTELEQDDFVARGFMTFSVEKKIPCLVIHHLNKQNAIRGNQKIVDHATGVFIAQREIEDYDKLDAESKALFTLIEKKDRAFGEPGVFNYYFHKGEFLDEFKPD